MKAYVPGGVMTRRPQGNRENGGGFRYASTNTSRRARSITEKIAAAEREAAERARQVADK